MIIKKSIKKIFTVKEFNLIINMSFDQILSASLDTYLGESPYLTALNEHLKRISTVITNKNYNADIHEDNDHIIINAQIPGFKKSEIILKIKDRDLFISAKKDETSKEYMRSKDFRQTIKLPTNADTDNYSATLCDGILEIKFNKLNIAEKQLTISSAEDIN